MDHLHGANGIGMLSCLGEHEISFDVVSNVINTTVIMLCCCIQRD